MKNVIGFLIKQNRLKQNLSQEGLCKNICVVSYLSKIEQGLVTPSDEIINQLFLALHINFNQDQDFLLEGRINIKNYFDKNLFSEDVAEEETFLLSQQEKLMQSDLYLSFHLFLLYSNILKEDEVKQQEELELLKPFLNYMEEEECFLYYLGMGRICKNEDDRKQAYENAEKLIKCSIIEYHLAEYYNGVGKYHEAILYATKGFNLAVEEGNVRIMLSCSLLIGTGYANEHRMELMLKFYERAASLARGFDSNTKYDIDYNIGATYVEIKRYHEGIPYLLNALKNPTMDQFSMLLACHKLAIAYGELGNKEKGQEYIDQAEKLLDEKLPSICNKLILFVKLRYEDHYLESDTYFDLIKDIYEHIDEDFAFGFKRFHGPFMLEAYTYRRKYKEALAVSMEIKTELFH